MYSGCNLALYELAFPTRGCFQYVRAGLCRLVIWAKGDSPRVFSHTDQVR